MTDHQIARLFEQEARLNAQLVAVRGRISAARREYADRNGYKVYPSVDALRKAVAG